MTTPSLAQIWKPIETAPKDNKRLLYLARLNEAGEVCELDFNGSWEYWEESWELAHLNGWCWTSANGIEEPTHWAYQDAGAPPASPSLSSTYANVIDTVQKALNKAWLLGQTYYQQADSDFVSQNLKAEETFERFRQLVDETLATIGDPPS